MKKILSVSLVVCMLLALSLTFTACAHKCEFSDEWSNDSDSHWHACEDEECTEVKDKAEHTWDDGNITAAATQEEDGVKTFTCKVCSRTKSEAVVFTGMTEKEWNSAFSSDVFENFSYKEASTTAGSGVSVGSETLYKFTKDSAYAKVTMAEQTQESYAPDKASADTVRDQLVDSIKDIASYGKFKYDAETKSYKAKSDIKIAALDTSTKDVTLKFADGKLIEIKYTVSFTSNGISFNADSTITLADYGTVVIDASAQ